MTQQAIPSGLGETLGWALEGTVGTFTTPARWLPHTKAEFKLDKKTAESQAVRNSRFILANRRALLSKSVAATVEMDAVDKQLGLFLKASLGSPATAVIDGATTLYTQNHVPGYLEGITLSAQLGVPTTAGAYQAFSYNGLKILDWTLSVQRGQIAKWAMTLDGWNEATAPAYTAAAYLAGASLPNLLTFASGSLLLGGTATTTAGVTTVASGAAPIGIVSAVSIKGTNKVDQERVPLGSQTKQEQLTNGFANIKGEAEIEFASLADFYTAFAADSSTVLQFSLLGGNVQSTYQSGLVVTLPAIKFDGETPNANGLDVIKVKVPFTAYDDGSGSNPVIQAAYTSTDTTP